MAIQGLACGRGLDGIGFVADDVIVTNAHVVAGATDLTVTESDGTELEATLIGFDPADDLAALRVEGGAVAGPAVRFGDADTGVTGTVLGEPFEVRRRIRASISDIYRQEPVTRLSLEIAAEIVEGDSGAPLVDDDGAVVGVVFANSRHREMTAYAIRAPEVEAFLDGLSGQPVAVGSCR